MGSRMKELTILMVDVSSSMKLFLHSLSTSLFTFVHSQLLFKPNNEVGLFAFGTNATNNDLNEEMKKRRKKGQYEHIAEIRSTMLPDISYLEAVEKLKTEDGSVDYINALTVAVDCIKRRIATMSDSGKYVKRILMFSTFSAKTRPAKPEFTMAVEEVLQNHGIQTEVFWIDFEGMKNEINIRSILGLYASYLTVRRVTSERELLSLFPAKPVAGTTMYRGTLEIGDVAAISIRVYKKTMQECLPTLKPYSDRLQSSPATHGVIRDMEYKKRDDPSEPIPPSFHIRGYSYGRQVIPMSIDIEKQIEYVPVKGMRLLGFVHRQQVPRFHYMKDCFVVVPESDEGSQLALSALVQQCAEMERVAIVQCALRKGSSVFLGVMTPFIDRAVQPDVFLMNVLPFADDVREFTFGSFSSKESLKPTEAQLELMSRIVDDEARMETGNDEDLLTDSVCNPTLNRFLRCLGKRKVEEIEDDRLSQLVFPENGFQSGKQLDETLEAGMHLFKKQKKDTAEDL